MKVLKSIKKKIFRRDGYRCLLCKSPNDLTIDHIKPVSRGGTNDEDNLQTLCVVCNMEKGSRHRIELDMRENKSDRAIRDIARFTNRKNWNQFKQKGIKYKK